MSSSPVRSYWRRATLGALLIGACTEPVYSDDGRDGAAGPGCAEPSCAAPAPMDGESGEGTNRDAGGDAEPMSEAGLDPVRSKWVGLYATRSFLFAQDSPLETTGRFLTLAEIKPSPDGGLVLEEELCLFDGEWAFVLKARLRVEFPGTRVSSVLTYDEEKFESALAKARIGYEASAAGCGAQATTASAQPQQVWLSGGTCACSTMDVPDNVRDCRLNDADRDQKPGFAFNATIGLTNYQYHVVQEERLRLLEGFQLGDRLYANREFSDTTRVLGCVVDGVTKRVADCPLGGGAQCAANTQKAEFVPLETPLTCRQLIERESALFLSPQPSFPSNCQQ